MIVSPTPDTDPDATKGLISRVGKCSPFLRALDKLSSDLNIKNFNNHATSSA